MYKQFLFACTTLALTACGTSTPTPELCPDCQEETDVDMTDDPIADLPCGGADVDKDNIHCGSCGNECQVDHPGGPFEAGNCNEGQCGPRWFTTVFSDPDPEAPPTITCEEVCAEYTLSCVKRGCSDLTGYSCTTLWGYGCSLTDPDQYPWGFEGSCTETFPWPALDSGVQLRLGCCCQPTI